jgi:hypothetical protein
LKHQYELSNSPEKSTVKYDKNYDCYWGEEYNVGFLGKLEPVVFHKLLWIYLE